LTQNFPCPVTHRSRPRTHTMPKRKGSPTEVAVGDPSKPRAKESSAKNTGNHRYYLMPILSPAKTLNLDPMVKDVPIFWTAPSCDTEKRRQVIAAMQKHAQKPSELRKILNVSAALADTAKGYWMAMNPDSKTQENKEFGSKACGYVFDGIAYKGLDIQSLSKISVSYLQDRLRIVDPLYGWLRPMDAIEPYRLEMASRGVFGNRNKDKLTDFWKPAIRDSIQQDEFQLQKTAVEESSKIIIVNLASDEYSAAVDWPASQVVKVVFRHAGRVLAVHAKRARGLMVRYMAEHNITTIEGLANFNLEGYSFQPKDSLSLPLQLPSDEYTSPVLVFDRKADSAPAPKKRKK
jgi:uncharacterized protein